MALDSAKKFLEAVKNDKSLEAKINEKGDASASSADEKLAKLTEVAKGEGYDFTVEELKEAAIDDSDLSLDELENVAGGLCKAFGSGDCTCFGDGGHCTCFGDNCDAFFT